MEDAEASLADDASAVLTPTPPPAPRARSPHVQQSPASTAMFTPPGFPHKLSPDPALQLYPVGYSFWGGRPPSLPTQLGRPVHIPRMLSARMSVEGWRKALLPPVAMQHTANLVMDFYWLIFLQNLRDIDFNGLLEKYVNDREARDTDRRKNRTGVDGMSPGAKSSSDGDRDGSGGAAANDVLGVSVRTGTSLLPPIAGMPQHLSPGTASPPQSPKTPHANTELQRNPYYQPGIVDDAMVADENDLIVARMAREFHGIFQALDSTSKRDALFRILPDLVAETVINVYGMTIPYASVIVGADKFHEMVDRVVSYWISGIERLTGSRRPPQTDAAGKPIVRRRRTSRFQRAAQAAVTVKRISRETDGLLMALTRGSGAQRDSQGEAGQVPPKSTATGVSVREVPGTPGPASGAPSGATNLPAIHNARGAGGGAGGAVGGGGTAIANVVPMSSSNLSGLRGAVNTTASSRLPAIRPLNAAHTQHQAQPDARAELKAELLALKKQIIGVFQKQPGSQPQATATPASLGPHDTSNEDGGAHNADSAIVSGAPVAGGGSAGGDGNSIHGVSAYSSYVAERLKDQELSWYERGKRKGQTQPHVPKGVFSLSQQSPLFGKFIQEKGIGNQLPSVTMTWVQAKHVPTPPMRAQVGPRQRPRPLARSPSVRTVKERCGCAPTPTPRGVNQWLHLMRSPAQPLLYEPSGLTPAMSMTMQRAHLPPVAPHAGGDGASPPSTAGGSAQPSRPSVHVL